MIWLAALLIGLVNAIVLYVFELVGIDGTAWLWNDVLGTDVYRWRVIPVAIILGLILTASFKLVKMKRIEKESSGEILEEVKAAPSTYGSIAAVLLVGAISLLAGASLGPEASLIAFSLGVGVLVSTKMKLSSNTQLMVVISIGALLVAFFHSFVLVLIPLLLLFQQSKKASKKVELKPVALILLAGVISLITILSIHHYFHTEPPDVIPPLPSAGSGDFMIALVLGFVSAFFAGALHYSVKFVSKLSVMYEKWKLPASDWLLGAGAGLLLGLLYLWGGQTAQFSGKIGSEELAAHGVQLGIATLLTLMVVKIASTALSSGTGYRGGLVFPAVFIGFTIGLLSVKFFPELGYTGAIVGSISGIMTAAVGSAVMGSIFLVAALPPEHWPLALCAIIGTLAYDQLRKLLIKKPA